MLDAPLINRRAPLLCTWLSARCLEWAEYCWLDIAGVQSPMAVQSPLMALLGSTLSRELPSHRPIGWAT